MDRELLTEQLDSSQDVRGYVAAGLRVDQSVGGVFDRSGPFYVISATFSGDQFYNLDFKLSNAARTSSKTRMRNMPFNLIVRAN